MSPLAAVHNDLPKAAPKVDGLVPTNHPRYVGVLVEQWQREDAAEGPRPTAHGTRFRHSDAGKCSRSIAYRAAGIEPTNPMDLAGTWNTRLGTLIHDAWQAALLERHADATIEVTLRVSDEFDGSGHADASIVEQRVVDPFNGLNDTASDERRPWRVTYELKTVGGWGFKAAVGRVRRGTPAEGPKAEHILQAALNGLADGADEIGIGYLAKECLSRSYKVDNELDRFAAEWWFPREVWEPMARAEVDRVQAILDLVDDGTLAARKIPTGDLPDGAEIVDPSKGVWQVTLDDTVVDTGSHWSCNYCPWQLLCEQTSPGRIPTDEAVEIRRTMEAK